jgi:hypothetical protein
MVFTCPGVDPFKGRSLVDGDGGLAEIEVLNPEAKGFHESQAGAIHELGGEFPGIFEMGDDRTDLLASHDDRWTALAAGRGEVIEGEVLDAEDVSDEEDHGVERLALGGWGDVAFEGEELKIGRDAQYCQFKNF